MNLQETIKRILREELSARVRRRVPYDEMENEFLESFDYAYYLTKRRKVLSTHFLDDLIYTTVSVMMDGIHWRLVSTLPEDEFWYDDIHKELENHYRDRIIQMYNEREGINESVLKEDKKIPPYFRRRIDLKEFEDQLEKGKVYIFYDSNSLEEYKWKLVTATLENYIYYNYDTEIDSADNSTYETIENLVNIFDDKLTDMYDSVYMERRPNY